MHRGFAEVIEYLRTIVGMIRSWFTSIIDALMVRRRLPKDWSEVEVCINSALEIVEVGQSILHILFGKV